MITVNFAKKRFNMKSPSYSVELSFEQIVKLVKKLPEKDKIKLTKELEKDILSKELTQILNAFASDKLSIEVINQEVEEVRSEIYAKKKTNQDHY